MTGKSGKDEKNPRSQPESLGYSAINVGWAVLPAGIARSGATEQRLLHDSVNRVTAGESWRKQKKRHCVYSAVMVVGSTGLVRSGATEYSRGVLRGVQANGGERVLLYQIGIAFARGGADKSAGLYDF